MSLDHLRRKATQPSAPVQVARSGGGDAWKLVAALLIGFVIGQGCRQFLDVINQGDRQEQHEHQQDKHEERTPVKGGHIVFVSDKKLPTADEDMLMREMPKWCAEHGVEYLWLDDEDPAGEKLRAMAEAKGITPPLVAYVRDKKIGRIGKWPSDLKALEAFVK